MLKVLIVGLAFVGVCAVAGPIITIPKGNYQVITKTLLPHLEENLRNAITRETRCLNQQDLSSLFPILKHPSFHECGLRKLGDLYSLVCKNNDAASGNAKVSIEPNRFQAQLNIKMGAKNMTMTQRTNGVKLSDCEPIN